MSNWRERLLCGIMRREWLARRAVVRSDAAPFAF